MIDEPTVTSQPPPAPRIWSALSVAVLSVLAAVIVGGIVQVVGLFAVGAFRPGQKSFDIMGAIQQLTEQPWGPAVLILPAQLTMFAVALVAALLSPHRLAPRLGYTRSALPWTTLPLLLGGTYFAAGLGGLLMQSLFHDPGTSMRMIIGLMQKASGAGLASLALLLCVLPPLAEETLFRGYVQRRLLQRWHPAAAIAASSLFFVAAHFDPVHVLAVLPLGVWLGVVAWRCDSLWPAMLCHAAQNSFALWFTRHADPFDKTLSARSLVALVVAGLLTVGAVVMMRRHPLPAKCGDGTPA